MAVEEAAVQEFTYLAADRCVNLDAAGRRPLVNAYWSRMDPHWCDGAGAESYIQLRERAEVLLGRATAWPGVTVVVTHEQFIRAVLLAVLNGRDPLDVSMRRFFALRTALPIPNGAIVPLVRQEDAGGSAVSECHIWVLPNGEAALTWSLTITVITGGDGEHGCNAPRIRSLFTCKTRQVTPAVTAHRRNP